MDDAFVLWVELPGLKITDQAGNVRPFLGRRRVAGQRLSALLPTAAVDAIHQAAGQPRETAASASLTLHGERLALYVAMPKHRQQAVVWVQREPESARELAQTLRFVDAIVENIPDMIFVKDAETLIFQRFNRAGEQLLGWSREELLGKTDHDFYPKAEADFFHEKDRETLARGELVDIPEEPIHTRAHGLRWLHTKKVPVLDEGGRPLYLLGISEDITERKLAQERAQALERELRLVVQHAPVAVITWSVEGSIVSWNPGAEQLYGRPAEHAIGRTIDELVPEAEREAFASAQRRVLAGQSLPPADVARRRGDFDIEVEEQLFLIRDPGGAPLRLGCVARDRSEVARLQRATELLGESGGDDTASTSAVMDQMLTLADTVARDPHATALLLGETGVGKSWLARRMHRRSTRARRPFFEVNCASLAPELAESELFGHERGAFTGADAQKRGLVEAADGGTLFLDEIGELPLGAQSKLLSFLDTHNFRRVGSTRTLRADVRILAATNRDLQQALLEGAFRRDLYYRISVVPIAIPPLRERREEIPALARQILAELTASRPGRGPLVLRRQTLAALQRYHWPGNIRELRNVLERLVLLQPRGAVHPEHLPPGIRSPGDDVVAMAPATTLAEIERRHILRVLETVGGNRTRAAKVLGIGRSTLKRKLAQFGREDDHS